MVSRTAVFGANFAAALLLPILLFPAAARAGVSDLFDSAIGTVSDGFDYIWPDDLPIGDFSLRLGAGVGITPDYLGSNDYRLRIIPLIDLRYKDILALKGNRLQVRILHHKHIKAGPLLVLQFGREEKRNPVLTGLGDVPDAVLAGGFVEGSYKGMFGSVEFRQALSGGQGASARFTLAQGLYQSEDKKTRLIVALRSNWNSRRWNQVNFGITPGQAFDSGLAAYAPGGGFSKLEIDILGRRQVTERWYLEWIAGYARMLGAAAGSPLVATFGSPNQFLAGIGGRYFF